MKNFDEILAYYQRKLSKQEEEALEESIFSDPGSLLILLGLKRIEEKLEQSENLEAFLMKSKEALKKKMFYE